jgi:ECF transporter S component (folate family)
MKSTIRLFIWIGIIVGSPLIFPIFVGVNSLMMLSKAKTKIELRNAALSTLFFNNLIAGILMLIIEDSELQKVELPEENLVRKITLSAMFIALGLILERVLMIPIGEVNRIAFGSSAIILASLTVGPLFGAVVGASIDLIGFFLNSVGTYTPYVTLGLAALGVIPWLLSKVMQSLKRIPGYYNLSYVLLATLFSYGVWFIYSREQYTFNLGGGNFVDVDLSNWFVRYLLPLLALALFFGFVFFTAYLEKRFPVTIDQPLRPKVLLLIVLVSEILISIVWGVQWRVWYLGIPPLALYFNQIAFFVIGFPIKSLIVITGYRSFQRFRKVNQ